jgi:hydroxypyruvate reductase
MTPGAEALRLWKAAVAAVDGYEATARALEGPAPDLVLAVGKAAGAMARAALDHFGPCPALVVTKDGHGAGLPADVQLIEAAHPVPDARSLAAGAALRRAVEEMPAGSRLLLLVSGGASALAEDPVPGETLASLTALNKRLLAAGLDIGAMNAERRKLSQIKGGGLLSRFRGARADVLAISDVPRDDIGVIVSGIGAAPADTPAFDYACRIVASNAIARGAAAAASSLPVLANEESLYDDVSVLAGKIGPRLRAMPRGALILGGEPTVILPDKPGQGGRNQALALELAREIAGMDDIAVVVGGTDGSDGPTDAAGGLVDGQTWASGGEDALAAADSGTFLAARNALLTTGPTGTNVMDVLVAVRG